MGYWIKKDSRSKSIKYICSECNEISYCVAYRDNVSICDYKICPRCGKNMNVELQGDSNAIMRAELDEIESKMRDDYYYEDDMQIFVYRADIAVKIDEVYEIYSNDPSDKKTFHDKIYEIIEGLDGLPSSIWLEYVARFDHIEKLMDIL